jgi:hypothetical protein
MNNLLLSGIGNIFKMDPITQEIELTVESAIIVTAVALLLGVFLSVIYILTHRKTGYMASMPTTLIILPVVVSTVIMLVGTNYASAFALAGVFTLIRFRSEPGNPKDISYIFATVSAGLCCGMGFILYAAVICAVTGTILVVVYLLKYGEPRKTDLKLKILVPEDLNYEDAFNDIFVEYGVKAHLDKVKTADFGTIYELVYRLEVPKDFKQKEFIDKLRTRNGNLNIILTLTDNLYTQNA